MARLLPAAWNRADIRYAWCGASSIVVDTEGRAGAHPFTGFYHRQTRFLRELRLELGGERPHVCSLADVAHDELEFAIIHPEVAQGGGGGSGSGMLAERNGVLLRGVDVRQRCRVHPASVEVSLLLTNRWQQQLELDVAWHLSADYATFDEAQFGYRQEEIAVEATSISNGVRFRSTHPELPFETQVDADGADWLFADGRLAACIPLARQQPTELRLLVRAVDFADALGADEERRREARLTAWHAGIADVFAPGEPPLIELTNRAITDLGSLALLEGAEDEWLTPAAGVPLYLTLWGRDALTTAWQAALFDRGEMLVHVLNRLARLQGERVDPERDEEPGRIIDMARSDPLSRIGRNPYDRYYADFASPFMFIIGLGYLYCLTGQKELVATHWDAARRVLAWAREYGDRDGDGYLEYLTRSPHGPSHQGWKDSENAVVDEHGHLVEPPIAPCEIQGYYHVALQFMAALSMVLGERQRAIELWREARDLKERFNHDFWMEDEGFIAFGLDSEKRQIRALTSNAGHTLPTGIVSDDHIPRLVRRLFQPDLFSGWGIRTLSTGNPAYNPLDYHLGSVWPVENATILFGLRRYGLNERALELTRALYDLARCWPGGRVPECVGGYARDEFAHPGAYPRANRPQTWNQSVFAIITQSLLGLVPFAPMQLLLVDPVLPAWLPELTIRRLRVGAATLSIRAWRTQRGDSQFEILEQDGDLHVVRQPWLESFSTGLWDRFAALRS